MNRNKIHPMVRTMLTALLLSCVTAYAVAEAQPQKDSPSYKTKEDKRKALWRDFHKARFEKYGKFQEIRIYCIDDSLTRVCYICEDGLFIFSWNQTPGTIERIVSAKRVTYEKINRITFKKKPSEHIGFFTLWYYETKEHNIVIGY